MTCASRPRPWRCRAQVAESVHREAFAGNPAPRSRALAVPDDRLLEIYNALRPYRSTKQELLDIAGELDGKYGAQDRRFPGSGGCRGL